MNVKPVSVLIVDDSATARLGIRAALRDEAGIKVVGEASNVEVAVALAERLRPDLITMDVYLEAGNGLDATARIMCRVPTPILVVTSAAGREPRLVYDAMAAGALEVAAKPPAPTSPDYAVHCRKLCRLVLALAQVPVVRKRSRPAPLPMPKPSPRQHDDWSTGEACPPPTTLVGRGHEPAVSRPDLIAVGGSTGAPPVIKVILASLAMPLPVPIAIVQHMTHGFGEGFARWLELETGRRVVRVKDTIRPEPNVVYVPVDDHHLEVAPGGRFCGRDTAPVHHHRPSVDVLFESAVRTHGGRVCAVLLTGMGNDGARGLTQVTDAGGFSLVQSPESCAVASMPSSAIALRAPSRVLDAAGIVEAIRDALGAPTH